MTSWTSSDFLVKALHYNASQGARPGEECRGARPFGDESIQYKLTDDRYSSSPAAKHGNWRVFHPKTGEIILVQAVVRSSQRFIGVATKRQRAGRESKDAQQVIAVGNQAISCAFPSSNHNKLGCFSWSFSKASASVAQYFPKPRLEALTRR